jgi:putative pyruvate formate lyase activating enzyme
MPASGNPATVQQDRSSEMLRECRLCPRYCGANRLEGETGFCGVGRQAKVAAISIHHGEEPPISGARGSGTVFFTHCNMACLFCQNYPISQMGVGREYSVEELGNALLDLERQGAHNVNFVTPTPQAPQMIAALAHARGKGFALPAVYNTNGYDSPEMLSMLEGIIEIYLPDMKYRSEDLAREVSESPGYPEHNAAAIEEMFRQVGPLSKGGNGVAQKGVLIRHLVLPGKPEETELVLEFLRDRFGKRVPLSLMGQYFPAYRAMEKPGFDRKLRADEYDRSIRTAKRMGLTNVFIQEL